MQQFIQVGNEWCGRPPPPIALYPGLFGWGLGMRLPLLPWHAHMHINTTHTHKQWDFFLRSYGTQNCSLVTRPLFSFPSLSVRAARKKMQSESRATSTLHKGSIINRTILLLHHTNIKNSDLELSDVAFRLSNKTTAERMNTKHYPNRVILIILIIPLPHMNLQN